MLTRLAVYRKLVAMTPWRRQMACSSCSINNVSISISHSRNRRVVYVTAYICLARQKNSTAAEKPRDVAYRRGPVNTIKVGQNHVSDIRVLSLCIAAR